MKLLILIMLLLLLAIPLTANAQEENTLPTVEENYWQGVESWIALWVGTLLAAGMAVATSVSTVKTLLLAPLKENTEFFNLEIYNGITVYRAAVLGLVIVMAGLGYTAEINPFLDAPIEWAQNIPEVAQALITVAIVSYLAVANHEFLDWLSTKAKPTAKG